VKNAALFPQLFRDQGQNIACQRHGGQNVTDNYLPVDETLHFRHRLLKRRQCQSERELMA